MPVTDQGPDVIVGICFHGIGTPSAGLEPAAHEYFVHRDLFLAVLDETAGVPGVQVSFDDGYASDVEVALPALADRGLTATFFPLAGMLGRPGYLDEAGVRALASAGMTVGSHGMHHRSWRGLDAEAEREELAVARSLIGAAAGTPVTSAACPFGSYDRRVLGTLRRHGYAQVFTSDRRRARAGAWLQPRYSIVRGDTLETVREHILTPRPVAERIRRGAAVRVKALR
jgi:peptidoglycan/xylan/chitin deacetylase (PgdA/CDA1 family)